MKTDIIKYIITTFLGAIIASLIAYIKAMETKIKNNYKNSKEEEDSIKEAVKILLRAELKRSCQYYINEGSISTDEYEELEEAIKVYESLGGNGLIHKLWDAVQDLDIN